jgi:septum formation protein
VRVGSRPKALGIVLFERIDTEDPTAIVGLPLIWLAGALRAVGFAVP